MLSIGEFARHGGVSVRMLRHYDTLGLLVPVTVDPVTGYRSYSASQLSRLHRLVALKDLGFTLAQLAPVLDADLGVEELRGMLRLRRAQIAEQISGDLERVRDIEARLRLIESEGTMSELEFTTKQLPALRLVQRTERVPEVGRIGERVGPMFEALTGALAAAGSRPVEPAVAWYDVDGEEVVIAAAFQASGEPPAGTEVHDLAGVERAMCVLHNGSMATISATWQALVEHVETAGLRASGPCREVYLATPDGDQDAWVTELQQPVVPVRRVP